jgi:acetylornithine deacetylase/succinyl-diaminopimelate desuccinylase-like protein
VHLAKYKEGEDAIEKLTWFMNQVYKKRLSLTNDKRTVIQFRKMAAESVGMSVCASANGEIEILLGANDSVEELIEKLRKLAKGKIEINLKPRKTPYLAGYYYESFPYQKLISEIIEKNTGEKMSLWERSSVGDDNVLASLGIPVITWGPDGDNAHAADEWVDLKSLERLADMYHQLLTGVKNG